MTSLKLLLDVHAEIKEKLAIHRDFVVGLEWDRAAAALEEFEQALRVHMDAEEKHVLPVYEARVGHVTGGDPQFFYLEHKNILRNLETAKEQMNRLRKDPAAGRRQAHEFLDAEHLLMQLLEHHDLREKNILYPMLDEKLSDSERAEILAACETEPPGSGPPKNPT